MPKGTPKKGKRNIQKIKCVICDNYYYLNGFDSHLLNKHKITTQQYRDKYGEYRDNELKKIQRNDNSNFKCLICNETCMSERHLSFHVRKKHNIDKISYIKKYIFNNKLPKCECGCGMEVTIIGQYPYNKTHISGHNSYMNLGSTRTQQQKMNMRESAISRMKRQSATYFHSGPSKFEQDVLDFIKTFYKEDILQGDTKILYGLELDIVIPKLNLAIECNGEHWHSIDFKHKNYHKNKTEECESKGIRLLHIWESDWTQKNEIIKSIIKIIFGYVDNKIYARNCTVKEITNKITKEFLNTNHLQGASVSKYRYGLYCKDELVQVITFSSLRKAVGHNASPNSYELMRLCSKKNTIIIGGASKLFDYFVKSHKPDYILSFANRDWSVGNVYEKIGFKIKSYTSPGYYYVKSKRRYHRYQFMKHKLVDQGFDPSKTEFEIMSERGYNKVYDTGNIKYEMQF